MKFRFRSAQLGISFFGLLILVAAFASLAVLGAQVFPTVIEYQAILKAAQRASAGNTVAEVKQIFDKAGEIDDFKSVAGKDLQISKNGDKVLVKFAYEREIHMFGPAYLLLKYSGQSK
jgi:hypothetical protein